MNKQNENIKKDTEIMKCNNKQFLELKNTWSKSFTREVQQQCEQEEDKKSKLEDRTTEIMECGEQKEKRMKKNEQSLRHFYVTIKHMNTCIMRVRGWREGEKEIWRRNSQKLPTFDKSQKSINPRSSMNSW